MFSNISLTALCQLHLMLTSMKGVMLLSLSLLAYTCAFMIRVSGIVLKGALVCCRLTFIASGLLFWLPGSVPSVYARRPVLLQCIV